MITGAANPKVRWMRSLAERQGRTEAHCFLIEGIHLVEEALQSGVRPRLLLFNRDQLESGERGRALLALLPGLPAEEASVEVLKRVADTMTPQGILAAVPVPEAISRPQPDEPLLLVLDGIQDPGNAGTLLRTAEAAGVRSVWTMSGSVDLYSPKVVRSAQGAHFRLRLHTGTGWDEFMQQVGRSWPVLVADSGGGTPYDQIDWTRRYSLVIGNEAHGPGAAAHAQATGTITIPMIGRAESLNAGVAGSIILFEALRQRRNAQHT